MKTNGKLPLGWQHVKLRDIARIDYGYTASAGTESAGPRFLRITDIQDGEVDWESVPFCEIGAADEVKKQLIDGDIVFARTGGTTGKSFLVRSPPRAVLASYLLRVRADESVSPEYLAGFFGSDEYWRHIKKTARGGAQPNVNARLLGNLDIPLPPIDEQKRIVAHLNEQMAAAEKARKAAEELLDAARALPNAFLQEALPQKGQPLPRGWRWVRLGDVCTKIKTTDPRGGPDIQFTYIDISSIDRSAKKVVSPMILMGRNAPSRARRVVHGGDVLVATTRPNLNAVAFVEDALHGQICSTGLCVLRPDIRFLDSTYLYHYTKHEAFVNALSNLVNGAMYPAVTDKQVLEQPIPLPPLAEQKRIVARLDEQMAAATRARRAADAAVEELRAMPSALLRRALAGAS